MFRLLVAIGIVVGAIGSGASTPAHAAELIQTPLHIDRKNVSGPMTKAPRGFKFIRTDRATRPSIACRPGYAEFCDVFEKCDATGCYRDTFCWCAKI
jgi:hypothetical protein